MLGGALQAVAQDAGEIQEHLGGDARVAQLDAAEEALVDGQHLEVAARHHVGAPLGVTHETHLAEDVAAPVLGDALPLLTAARPHLGATADDDVHLVAQLAAPDHHLARREASELAHEDDDARLRGTEAGEERDRPGRLLAELHPDQVPERDHLGGGEERREEHEVRPERRGHGESGQDAEVLDRHEAREGEGEKAEEERHGRVHDRHADGPDRADQRRHLVGLAAQLEVQPRHVVDGRVDRDAERDRGDQARAEVQQDAEPAHHAEEQHDRHDVRQDREESDPRRQEHQREDDEDDPERERQALDLPGHDVRRRTRDQYEVAGDVHAQLGREVRADPVADVRERLLDATRSREVGAHEDVGLAEVLRHDALERGRTRGDHAEHRLEVLRLLEERLRLRRRDDVAVLVDDEVARAAPVEAALEQLHVVDQRDRRGDAG